MHSPPHWTARRVILATITVLAIACAFWLLYQFRTVWVTLFVAIVLASSLKPLVDGLTRKGMAPTAAALGVHVALLALAVGFVVLVLPMVLDQLPPIAQKLNGLYQGMREHLLASPSRMAVGLARYLPPTLSFATGGGPTSVAQSFHTLALLLRGISLAIAVPVLGFYWTVDGERAVRTLLLVAPVKRRQGARAFVAAAEQKMGAYMRGQALVCAFVGMMALPAYLVIGLPHAFVLALMAGVLELVPYLGSILAAGMAVLIALTASPLAALWVLIALVAINLIQSYVIAPRVMHGAVGVSPFARLLAITAFGFVGGIPGAFVAIPAAAILQLLFEGFARHRNAEATAKPEEDDRLSLLRREAQQIASELRQLGQPNATKGRAA
jgi:predicted PurR-regulated permease PerM